MTPVTKVDITRRAMYQLLDRIKRAAKHRILTKDFEDSLEGFLTALAARYAFKPSASTDSDELMPSALSQALAERDEYQARMMAVDTAYADLSKQHDLLIQANRAAGDELREALQIIAEQKELIIQQRQAYAKLHRERPMMQTTDYVNQAMDELKIMRGVV
jgi:hypothetical protein